MGADARLGCTVAADIAVEAASPRPLYMVRLPEAKGAASHKWPPAGAPILPDIALQMGQSPR